MEELPPDLVSISDLLVGPGGEEEPNSVQDFRDGRLSRSFHPGDRIAVGWEVHGLGWRREEIEYRVELVRREGGLLRSAGRFLGLVGDPVPVELGWTELVEDRLGPVFRGVVMGVPPELEPGEYRLRVELRSSGRRTLVAEETIELLPTR